MLSELTGTMSTPLTSANFDILIKQFEEIIRICNNDERVKIFVDKYLFSCNDAPTAFQNYAKDHKQLLTGTVLSSCHIIIKKMENKELKSYMEGIYGVSVKDGNDLKNNSEKLSKSVPITSTSVLAAAKVFCNEMIVNSKSSDLWHGAECVTSIGKEKMKELKSFLDSKASNILYSNNGIITIENIFKYSENIISIVMNDPNSDVYYTIMNDTISDVEKAYMGDHKLPVCKEQAEKTYISGSFALEKFINYMKTKDEIKKYYHLDLCDIKHNDIDIFMLNSKEDHHFKMDKVDLVYTSKKTIQDVLNNFDLPCVRVAIDYNGNFIVSSHCITAILTGVYFLPSILCNNNFTNDIVNDLHSKLTGVNLSIIRCKLTKIFNRIEKYKKRGFDPIYDIDITNHVIFNNETYKTKSNY